MENLSPQSRVDINRLLIYYFDASVVKKIMYIEKCFAGRSYVLQEIQFNGYYHSLKQNYYRHRQYSHMQQSIQYSIAYSHSCSMLQPHDNSRKDGTSEKEIYTCYI